MPIYEYACYECIKTYEFIHRYNETLNVVCDVCSEKLNKIVSASGFRLLGGGWEQGKPPQDWD